MKQQVKSRWIWQANIRGNKSEIAINVSSTAVHLPSNFENDSNVLVEKMGKLKLINLSSTKKLS